MMKHLRHADQERLREETVRALGLDPIAQALHAEGFKLLPVRLPRQQATGRARLRLVWKAADGESVVTVRYTRLVRVG